jgi:NDP-sugar pyrophosphorylase family protein
MYGSALGNPFMGGAVFVGKGSLVEQGAMIKGPHGSERTVRFAAAVIFARMSLSENGVVAGNSCEFKNCLVFDEAQVPHFNYVGDSLLGYKAHLGAGVILSNVKLDHTSIGVVRAEGSAFPTGLRKFGAVVGDYAEIGCHSVLSPGSIIGRRCIVYPGVRGLGRPRLWK